MAKTVSSAPALKSQDGRDSFNFQVLLFWLTCVCGWHSIIQYHHEN